MKSLLKVEVLRPIKVKYLPPTNHRGARVKIFEPNRQTSVIVPYDYSETNDDTQAFNLLTSKGFNIVARAYDGDTTILLCDNWGENFIDLKTIKE